jgi:hydroxymethylglutaryl-CoA reductase (NADPH)
MPVSNDLARRIAERLLAGRTPEEAAKALRPRLPDEFPLPPRLPASNECTAGAVAQRRAVLAAQGIATARLAAADGIVDPATLGRNIENLVGFAQVPIGVIGPLRIRGTNALGDFYVPMATTEGALVASYGRGAYLISHAGGAAVLCLAESVMRAPCMVFGDMIEAAQFLAWAVPQFDTWQEIVARTSRHCRIVDLQSTIIGREVYLGFEFETGDAAGQNMVTFATDAICHDLLERAPVRPRIWFLEGNMSGDKKATLLAFARARGKKIVADVTIPRSLLRHVLHTEPEDVARYWQASIMGGVQSGSIGVQGHFANALAAIFIACGQDAACVSEASVGMTRIDVTEKGDLYASVSLPNLIVGSVGGGTHLPVAQECLAMLGCTGEGGSRRLAEICAATALAGEISIGGSMAAGDFAKAHAAHGRDPARRRP